MSAGMAVHKMADKRPRRGDQHDRDPEGGHGRGAGPPSLSRSYGIRRVAISSVQVHGVWRYRGRLSRAWPSGGVKRNEALIGGLDPLLFLRRI
jgi:hypothetical protein